MLQGRIFRQVEPLLTSPSPRPPITLGATADSVTAVAKALRKNWPTVLAVTLASLGLGLLYGRSQPRVYEPSRSSRFDRMPPSP